MSIVTYNNRSIANISAIPGAAKSLTHIKTLTASSSSTLSFVDGSSDVVLDSTYPIYVFKFINMHSQNNSVDLTFNFNTDGGSNYNVTKTTTHFWTANYESLALNYFTYGASLDLAQSTSFQIITDNVGNENDESSSGTMTLFNPSSTTFVKHFMTDINTYGQDNSSYRNLVAGYGNTTSAVDAIQFKMSSGNIDAGTIKLYGIKDS
jgi:hypothetical protein